MIRTSQLAGVLLLAVVSICLSFWLPSGNLPLLGFTAVAHADYTYGDKDCVDKSLTLPDIGGFLSLGNFGRVFINGLDITLVDRCWGQVEVWHATGGGDCDLISATGCTDSDCDGVGNDPEKCAQDKLNTLMPYTWYADGGAVILEQWGTTNEYAAIQYPIKDGLVRVSADKNQVPDAPDPQSNEQDTDFSWAWVFVSVLGPQSAGGTWSQYTVKEHMECTSLISPGAIADIWTAGSKNIFCEDEDLYVHDPTNIYLDLTYDKHCCIELIRGTFGWFSDADTGLLGSQFVSNEAILDAVFAIPAHVKYVQAITWNGAPGFFYGLTEVLGSENYIVKTTAPEYIMPHEYGHGKGGLDKCLTPGDFMYEGTFPPPSRGWVRYGSCSAMHGG